MVPRAVIDVGRQVRLNRIFNPSTGKTVMVPLDHGIIFGPATGIEDPAATVRKVVAGGADAVVFNGGLAASIYREYTNRCGAIFNLTNTVTSEEDLTMISSVEYAVRGGADGVSVQVQIGSPTERHMLNNARIVAEECSRWGMPLLGMVYPTERLRTEKGAEADVLAARVGAELGMDIVKTSYPGDRASFKRLVEGCPVPLVVAGGPRAASPRAALDMVEDAMQCGAAGVALGRNVWQSADPTRMTAALVDIVHNGKSAAQVDIPE